jgi:hypothetical protein
MLLALFSNGNSLAAAGGPAGLAGNVLLEGALALPPGNRYFDSAPRLDGNWQL